MIEPTDKQKEIMMHALGSSHADIKTPLGWRNYYNAPADATVYPALQEMVGLGFLDQTGDYFHVMPEWKQKLISEWRASLDKTWWYRLKGDHRCDRLTAPTRGKARYEAFLLLSDCYDIKITDVQVYAREPK